MVKQHYCDYMITSVRESKARLSELVNRAAAGEDVVITVRGKPTARLVAVAPDSSAADQTRWVSKLRRLHRKKPKNTKDTPSEEIVSSLREERA